MKVNSASKVCPKCGGALCDSDGEWAGELNGVGRVVISGCDCVDCLTHFVFDEAVVLTGM